MSNRLAHETSPYLLQHKDNPVDWYPWGDDALARARAEDKPIFLSIGYSACHWCHVMERESFENHDIAAQMNRDFINIKVDREERPDLDGIYMTAVQALTGRGGWPMSVFLTPDGRPFHGGTYFPPEDRHGMPGFPRLLTAITEAYTNRRGDIEDASRQITDAVRAQGAARQSTDPLTRDILDQAAQGLVSQFDPEHGGLRGAPKFPQPMTYEFLLRYWRASGSGRVRDGVALTLEKMARGGMYDQIGGGFHRYSVDAEWLVPHFEKMLYDNALLPPLFLHAYQATGRPLFRRIVEQTLEYVLREMTHPEGGFFSATDADSEGEEGKFFVWTPAGLEAVLGPEAARIAGAYWDVTEAGNFEGSSILNVPRDAATVAAGLGIGEAALLATLEAARPKLYEARSGRVAPGLDDKVLVAWNGLMMRALAECGAALDRPGWVEAARRNAAFLLDNLVDDGRVLRAWRDGRAAPLRGYLEDYASLADGLLALYEATFEQRWLDEAIGIADRMLALFWAPGEDVFYDTGTDHEALVVRPRDIFDNAQPCGGSVAALLLLRLSVFTGNRDYERYAVASMRSVRDFMPRLPSGIANWLAALDFYLSTPREVVLVGPRDAAMRALLDVVYRDYAPNLVLAGAEVAADPAPAPLLEGRVAIAGRPTAYVCENYVCALPATTPEALAAQLARTA